MMQLYNINALLHRHVTQSNTLHWSNAELKREYTPHTVTWSKLYQCFSLHTNKTLMQCIKGRR